MTLVIAAQGSDFLILGADSRASKQEKIGGTRIEINFAVKLIQITERVGILVYGDANISDYLIEKFKEKLPTTIKNVTEIAEKFSEFCISESEKSKKALISDPPDFGFIVAGLDKKGPLYTPRCFTLRSLQGFQLGVQKDYAIVGKDVIAFYLFTKNYQQGMIVNVLSKLVADSIRDTGDIDGDVGGAIRMARIDQNGFTEYSGDDVMDSIKGESSEAVSKLIEGQMTHKEKEDYIRYIDGLMSEEEKDNYTKYLDGRSFDDEDED